MLNPSIQNLPREVLSNLFSYLPFNDKLKKTRVVSKVWHQESINSINSIKPPELTPRPPVPLKAMCINTVRGDDLSSKITHMQSTISKIIEKFTSLSLNLTFWFEDDTVIIEDQDLLFKSMFDLFLNSPKLTYLILGFNKNADYYLENLDKLPGLKKICLVRISPTKNLLASLAKAPSLTEIILVRVGTLEATNSLAGLTNLTRLHLEEIYFTEDNIELALPPTITDISLICCNNLSSIRTNELPNLQNLTLAHLSMHHTELTEFLQKCPNLRTLSLENFDLTSLNSLASLRQLAVLLIRHSQIRDINCLCSALESLTLTKCKEITNESLAHLNGHNYPNLKNLDISYNPRITSLRGIIQGKLPNLQKINICGISFPVRLNINGIIPPPMDVDIPGPTELTELEEQYPEIQYFT